MSARKSASFLLFRCFIDAGLSPQMSHLSSTACQLLFESQLTGKLHFPLQVDRYPATPPNTEPSQARQHLTG